MKKNSVSLYGTLILCSFSTNCVHTIGQPLPQRNNTQSPSRKPADPKNNSPWYSISEIKQIILSLRDSKNPRLGISTNPASDGVGTVLRIQSGSILDDEMILVVSTIDSDGQPSGLVVYQQIMTKTRGIKSTALADEKLLGIPDLIEIKQGTNSESMSTTKCKPSQETSNLDSAKCKSTAHILIQRLRQMARK
jgi:hypothetical protein